MEEYYCINRFTLSTEFAFEEGNSYQVYWWENGFVTLAGIPEYQSTRFKFQTTHPYDSFYLYDYFIENKPFKFGR